MKRFRSFWVLLALVALLGVACGGGAGDGTEPGAGGESPAGEDTEGAASGESLSIGVVVPLSGDFASAGQEVFRGYEMAVDRSDIECEIELVQGDAFAPEDAISEVDRLVNRENVDMFVGTYASPTSEAGSEAAARHDRMWYETHALTDGLTDRGLETYIRGGPTGAMFGEASANFITEVVAAELDADTLNVFGQYVDNTYGDTVFAAQEGVLTEAGYTVNSSTHAVGVSDVTDVVLAAQRANPDVWLITGYVPDMNLLLRTAAEQGFDPPVTVLTGTGDGNETYEAVGGSDLAGTFVVAYPHISEENEQAYRDKYGGDPIGTVANTGLTGMTGALELLKITGCDTDPAALWDAGQQVDIPIGELPNGWGLKFDETGQNQRIRLVAVQWREDGTTPTVWPDEVADGDIQ